MEIRVGKTYEEAFKNIYRLYELGLCHEIISEASKTRIVEASTNNVFIYDRSIKSVETSKKNKITNNGATWFGFLNSEDVNDDVTLWDEFMTKIGDYYHNKYSLIEYNNYEATISLDKQAEYIDKTKLVFNKFFNENALDYDVIYDEDTLLYDDIYIANIKMLINAETGESQVVLGKLYYKAANYNSLNLKLNLINRSTAISLLKTFNEEIGESDKLEVLNDTDGSARLKRADMITKVFNQLDEDIKEKNGNVIKNNVVFDSDYDNELIANMLKSTPLKHLLIRNISILSIIHLKRKKAVFNVINKNTNIKTLQASFSIDGSITLRCLLCNSEESLIEDNLIKVGNEIYTIDLANLSALSDTTITKIRREVFKPHLVKISCNVRYSSPTEKVCSRIICDKTSIVIDGEMKCNNCHHPEIVYTDKNGVRRLTRNLNVTYSFTNEFDFIDLKEANSNLKKCNVCERITSVYNSNGLCPLCQKAYVTADNTIKLTELELKDAELLYKTYVDMLSPYLRGGRPHYAFEDSDKIIIISGNNKYLFDKLEIKEAGYLPNPKKIKYKWRNR